MKRFFSSVISVVRLLDRLGELQEPRPRHLRFGLQLLEPVLVPRRVFFSSIASVEDLLPQLGEHDQRELCALHLLGDLAQRSTTWCAQHGIA